MAIKKKDIDGMFNRIEKTQGRRPTPGTPFILSKQGFRMTCWAYIADDRIWKGGGSDSVALPGAQVEVNATGQLSKHFSMGGELMFGALGATKKTDTRKLFLVVQGTDNGFVLPLPVQVPGIERSAMEFAVKANAIARQGASAMPEPHGAARSDVPDQIRKVSELHDQGILSDAEFESKKTDLLARL